MLAVIQYILLFISGLLCVLPFGILLTPRRGKKITVTAVISLIFFVMPEIVKHYIVGFVKFLPFSLSISAVVIFALYFFIILSAYKEKFTYKFFLLMVFSFFMVLDDGLSAAIYVLLSGKDISNIGNSVSSERIICLIIYNILYFILIMLTVYLLRRKQLNMNKKSFMVAVIFLLFQFFLMGNTVYTHRTDYSLLFVVSFTVEFVLCLATDAFVFKALIDINKTAELEAKIKWSESLKASEENYYNTLQGKTREVMKLRHEINDRIQTAMLLMKSDKPDNSRKALEILESTYTQLEATRLPVFCENAVCNMVVNSKIADMEREKIKYNINLDIPKDVEVKSSDLCGLFSNLINNAVEGCKKLEEEARKIDILAKQTGQYLTVNVSNPIKVQPQMKKGRIKTTKTDAERHGFGLELMEDICKDYDGMFSVETTENEFLAKAVVKDLQ